MAEWLYNLSKTDNNNIKVNINANSDYAFTYSCDNGHNEMLNGFITYPKLINNNIKININQNSDYAFR